MRPLRLELKGFTAFRDPQSIDFSQLDLFAISGPTGSGKTSILDAMTYALFGYIDRVGKQAAQFVSQGQPRLAVTLEFAVGVERYRVTRRTPTKGATKILLETWNGTDWEQAGEGADRVNDVNARIREAIGLEYDAFTRTVLLPQGRFAEFLVGDARKRREILTDLLGLELFERLARRAGEVKREATLAADMRAQVLESEYAGVGPDAVRDADGEAKRAAATEERLVEAERAVRELAERWAETERSIQDLRACAIDAERLGVSAADAADALSALAGELAGAEAAMEAAVGAAAGAAAVAERAATELREALDLWGSPSELGAVRAKAEALVERRARVAGVEEEAGALAASRPALRSALEEAERALAERVAEAEGAIEAVTSARAAEERAAHADHVAAVRAAVRVGDRCPVCGKTVEALAGGRRGQALEKARAARVGAEGAAERAESVMREAASAHEAADRDVRDADAEVARVEKELERARGEVAALEAAVGAAFGGDPPADPVAAVAGRLGRLEDLDRVCDDASAAAADAARASADAERRRQALDARLAEIRAGVDALPVAGVQTRAGALLGEGSAIPSPGRSPSRKDASSSASSAAAVAEAMTALAGTLASAAAERASGESALLEEANELVGGIVEPQPGLERLVASVTEARTAAARAAATTEQRAGELRAKLANAERIAEEMGRHRGRAGRFDGLAKELRADRIIAFLQLEALELLAAAGSRGLSTLSSGRYRLEFADDEFYVVDTWNGEERRSARTLSGGETFLASLALALGLSEQVRALAVSDRERLDALFLDEGFGTLDPETLEVVVDAIEQLGGDGRMVGVITHVQELAMRLPARIEIEKSPRGSALRVVT